MGIKKGGGSEIQALRFDKDKFTPEEAKAWAKKHGHSGSLHPAKPKPKDHAEFITAANVSVRQPLKNVSVKYDQAGQARTGDKNIFGQSDPGQGMGYVPDAVHPHEKFSMDSINVTYGSKATADPVKDVPAGSSDKVGLMPIPAVKDPKSSLTDQQIKTKQEPKKDDVHTLEHEAHDLSGITYGTAAAPTKVLTRPPLYGAQRMVPSAYAEKPTPQPQMKAKQVKPGEVEDPQNQAKMDLFEHIIDLIANEDIDAEALIKGMDHEKEHTDDPLLAAKLALDHIKEHGNDYYDKLEKVFPEGKGKDGDEKKDKKTKDHAETVEHAEYPTPSTDLKEVDGQVRGLTQPYGIGLGEDINTTQAPVKNIHQDVAGELMMKRDEPIYNEGSETDDEEMHDGTWVVAFKAGLNTDSDGVAHKWFPEDIDKIAQQYNKATDKANPERHIAPVVVGHPKDDSPAYGWIEKAKAFKDKLYLKLANFQPEFVDAVKRNLYKTRSISLYPDLNIRHIGFLGGAVPAVKGLVGAGTYKFKEGEEYKTYEFSGADMEDINGIKAENNFFKKLFSIFNKEVKEYSEGVGTKPTTSDIQAHDQPVPYKTIDSKYPKGATMSQSITSRDHMKYAKEYLDKMLSHTNAAITGESGTDISAHKEASVEFGRLAKMHMGMAHAQLKPKEGEIDSWKETNGPDDDDEYCTYHDKLTKAYADIEKALVSGNYMEPLTVVEDAKKEEAPKVEDTKTSADHVELPAGTKAIPVQQVKDDKEELTAVREELNKVKDELNKVKLENEKLLTLVAQKQAQQAKGEYREFVEKLRDEGRIKPVDVELHINTMESLASIDETNAKDFAENKAGAVKTDRLDQYKSYLSSMPRVIDLNEELMKGRAPAGLPENKEQNKDAKFVEDEIARLRAANSKLTYHEALNMTQQVYPDKVSAYVEAGFGN